MSIPVTPLGSQVFVHLPGMSSQVHEPCQDMHICGVCKLSFTSVENFLTHKKIVCGKEIVQPTSPDITITSSAVQQETSSPASSIQTILQHPTTFITPTLSSAGGSLIHSSGDMPLGGQILRVLLGNNEILIERSTETQGTTISDLLPDETLQLLPDLSIRKGLNEKHVLNGACNDKVGTEKVKNEGEVPLEQAEVIREGERSIKRECQIFQHDEENVVSLLANQLVTTNSLAKQGADCSYPGAIINVQCLAEETTTSSNGISIPTTTTPILSHSNLASKAKPGILLKKGKGKSSEEGILSKSDSFELSALDKPQHPSKEGKQEHNAKVCMMTEGAPEEDDEMASARKRMPGLFKQRKIHMCAVETCEFTTTFTKDLIRHMRKHTGERPFKCEKCSRWFSRADKLRTHLRIHAGLKPHACNLCPYKAVDSGSLRKHMRVHTDERPYKCQICPYSARDSSQLTVHLRTHTGDHPFICSYKSCNASFKTSSDLKRHFRTHTGEKPFECQLCPYKCSISSNLKAHMRQNHSENKTLSCSICSFNAPSKHALKEHEKTHCQPASEGDVLRCNTCGFSCFGMEAMTQHLKSNPHCEYASSDFLTKSKEAPASAQRKPFRCSDCDFTCMLRGNLKNHIQRKHCIGEDGVGGGTKKKGKGSSKGAGPTKSRRGRGGRRCNMAGEGPPFCLRSHHCPICNVSFVREDSWRSHIRQHQTKGEGLDIPLGPMMPSLVDSSETAIISAVQENPCGESPNSLISLPEEGQANKLMSGRPFIITFEGNGKSQEEAGSGQGETGVISGFEEPPGENHSVLLYVQADQDASQNQDDENLRNGAEILASLNQSIPMHSSLANNTKPIAIAPAPNNSQQHTILLTAPQPSGHSLKAHITNESANTCQYIALPHEQTAIMDQLTAALQPGLQYMISGPLEAIMALPSALEQRQMTITSENQKNTYDGSVISLQLNSEKENAEIKDE